MKETVFGCLKKIAVMLIASVMVLGLVPAGMMIRPTTVNAEGEFLRLLPETDAAFPKTAALDGAGVVKMPADIRLVGEAYDAYLRFDLTSLLEKEVATIREAKLRLALVRTPQEAAVPVRVWLMSDAAWGRALRQERQTLRAEEVLLAEFSALPQGEDSPTAVEIDLTDYLKKWIEDGRGSVALHLDALGAPVAAAYAGADYEDPAFRPCLKVMEGNADDPDRKDLTKTWLAEGVTVGETEKTLMVGGGKETLLKFGLHRDNIQGAAYQAKLCLNPMQIPTEGEWRVYLLGSAWDAERVRAGETPEGERKFVCNVDAPALRENAELDVTDAFAEAFAQGAEEITFLLCGDEESVCIPGSGKGAPWLALRVSDDADVVAVMEATTESLGKNTDASVITESLPSGYTAKNGNKVLLRWQAFDAETGVSARQMISSDGTLTRPLWFEDEKKLLAVAEMKAGAYSRERAYALTIQPEPMPEYRDTVFESMVDIGSEAQEKKRHFASVGAEADSRWQSGKKITWRALGEGGVMALQFASDPAKQNYLTLKLWGGDSFAGVQIRSLQDRSLPPVVMEAPTVAGEEDGFLYLTYPLPMEYTQDRDFVSLQMTAASLADASAGPQRIYAAYLSQSAYFDPLKFSDQGEAILQKSTVENMTGYAFLEKLYAAAQRPLAFFGANNEPASPLGPEAKGVYISEDLNEQLLVIRHDGVQIAISLSEESQKAEFYRDTRYYTAVSQAEVQEYFDGKLQALDYGAYRIFKNRSHEPLALPWREEGVSGLYHNLKDDTYRSFLKRGEKKDDSVLPEGTEVLDGAGYTLLPGETVALVLVAEPLRHTDWRVSEINREAVSTLDLHQSLQIQNLTFRNMGSVSSKKQELVLLCGVYERGMLVDMRRKTIVAQPGAAELRVAFFEGLRLEPGQTVKVFLEEAGAELQRKKPILELP